MTLIDVLPNNDKNLIHKYAKVFSSTNFTIGVDNFLTPWSENKQNLYKLLGNKFIHSFHYKIKTSSIEPNDIIKLWSHDFIDYFLDLLEVAPPHLEFFDVIYNKISNRFNFEELVRVNHIVLPDLYIDEKCVFKYQKNMKLIKTLKKVIEILIKYYGAPKNILEVFEDFRCKHSVVVSNVPEEGEMYISIHPMDYMTMSDNDNNWSSCMSWIREGDYRLGTLEMLNSENVLVVYTKSNNKYTKISHGMEWNSKTWRTLFVFDNDCIISNKQYPITNDAKVTLALEELKKLAKQNLGEEYFGTVESFDCNSSKISILTASMYNDFYSDDYKHFFIIKRDPETEMSRFISISGPAYCLECGKVLLASTYSDTNEFLCAKCLDKYEIRGGVQCSICGSWAPRNHIITCEEETNICPSCYYKKQKQI